MPVLIFATGDVTKILDLAMKAVTNDIQFSNEAGTKNN
jgi:hypothetical protein